MATPGRKPNDGLGRIPGSGRRPGTPNSRKLPETVKADLLYCYKTLGGRKFLLTYLKEHPDELLKNLMRFIPVPREESPVVGIHINADSVSITEAAARVAYVLAASAHAQGLDEVPTRVLEVVPEPPAVEPTAPELPPSAPPVEDVPPTGFTYAGSREEQDRERPRRTTSITKARRNLL